MSKKITKNTVAKRKVLKKVVKKRELKKVVIRTYSAGVFVAELVSRKGKEAILNKCTRLWRWSGANSLSQLANEGVKNPSDCKFSVETNGHEVTEVIEVIPMNTLAWNNIKAVKVWKQ